MQSARQQMLEEVRAVSVGTAGYQDYGELPKVYAWSMESFLISIKLLSNKQPSKVALHIL